MISCIEIVSTSNCLSPTEIFACYVSASVAELALVVCTPNELFRTRERPADIFKDFDVIAPPIIRKLAIIPASRIIDLKLAVLSLHLLPFVIPQCHLRCDD
jgi:hypothetical protein